jgi:hypothetical protein
MYLVSVTINCNSKKSTITFSSFIYISASGMKEHGADNLIICPNPFEGSFRMDIPDSYRMAAIKIYDKTGKLMYSVACTQPKMNIETSSWPRGIYIMRLINESGDFLTRSVVKQ